MGRLGLRRSDWTTVASHTITAATSSTAIILQAAIHAAPEMKPKKPITRRKAVKIIKKEIIWQLDEIANGVAIQLGFKNPHDAK